MDGTQVAHEHVCGFVASLCFVIVVLFLAVDDGLYLSAAIFQMMTWPDPILE